MIDPSLPAAGIVEEGLRDLERLVESIPSLLVSMAAERMRFLGVPVPEPVFPDPEDRLYDRLENEFGDGAHSKYNAYRRLLVSFLHALPCARKSTQTAPDRS